MVDNTIRPKGRVRILLVEDSLGDQELTREAFRRSRVDNELHIVSDGQEAMEFLEGSGRYLSPDSAPRPDIVLLDINLPRLNGLEVLEKVRANPELATLPIVMLSTSSHDEDVLRAYGTGANSYLTKPVRIAEFYQLVDTFEQYWFETACLPPRDRS